MAAKRARSISSKALRARPLKVALPPRRPGPGVPGDSDDDGTAPALSKKSPYLTPDEAAPYLKYKTGHALMQATRRFGIPHIKLGRRVLYVEAELDQFMKVATAATTPASHRKRR